MSAVNAVLPVSPSQTTRSRSVPIAHEMVTAVVDVFGHVDVFIHVLHYDLIPDVINIGPPVGNTIVKILGINRPVIRDVVCIAVTDADAGIVGAAVEAENSHQKRCSHDEK